jgi:hypothetical protein
MQGMQKGMAAHARADWPLGALFTAAALCLAAGAAGCSSIETPLPDLKPAASTSLTQAEKTKAMEELAQKRATHEHDAEQQIEQSR